VRMLLDRQRGIRTLGSGANASTLTDVALFIISSLLLILS
jgi:hypothetical protein